MIDHSMLRLSRRLSLALGALAAGTLFGACARTPSVSLAVALPSDVAANAKWIEVGVFEGAQCPESKQLVGGLPPNGWVSRLAFRTSDGSPPPLGNLKKGSYAFAAVARGDDCAVLGAGCTVVDESSAHDVSIPVRSNQNPATACSAGSTCSYARCVPSHDNGALGAGCSMQLVGAGPLGDPLVGGGTIVSAPSIVATDTGFLLAYREYEGSLGSARLTIIPIDAGGGAGVPVATTLPMRCAGVEESDATGLAFAGKQGLAAVARAPCGGAGGVDLFQIDASGAVLKSSFNGAGGVSVTLATAHPLAVAPNGTDYFLAFTEGGATHVATVTGLSLQSGAAPGFGGAPPQSSGWVATSDKVIALASAGTGAIASDAGAGEGGAGDAGTGGAAGTIRVNVAAAGANLATLPAPYEIDGTFASVAAIGTRALVVTDSPLPDSPVAWSAFDLGRAAPAAGLISIPGLGKVLYADVALRQDHAFVAIEQPGAITVVALDHATTKPTLLRTVFLPNEPRAPAMTTVRDGRVAVAASDSRVAIVWTTGKSLGQNDTVGGYAVLACTTP